MAPKKLPKTATTAIQEYVDWAQGLPDTEAVTLALIAELRSAQNETEDDDDWCKNRLGITVDEGPPQVRIFVEYWEIPCDIHGDPYDEPRTEYRFELGVVKPGTGLEIVCYTCTGACVPCFRGGLLWLKERLTQYKTVGLCRHCNRNHLCMPHTTYCAECAMRRIVRGQD